MNMCKNVLKNKKNIVLIGIIAVVLLAVFYFARIYRNETSTPEINEKINSNFQELTNTDFSNIDSNIMDEVLERIKEEYNNIQEKLNIDPLDYDANIAKASILYRVKEYDKAILIYQKLGEQNSDDYNAFKSLGDVYYAQKKSQEAEQAYLIAIKNNAHSPNAYLQLAEVYKYFFADDTDKIKKFFEEGIAELGTNRFSLIQSYAGYLEHIGEIENSIKQWKIVSDEFPENQQIKDKILELEASVK